jgi:hypothetical protein
MNAGVEIASIAASKRCLLCLKCGWFSVFFIFLAEFWLSLHRYKYKKSAQNAT